MGGPGLSHQPLPKTLSRSRTCKERDVVSLGRQFPHSRSAVGFLRTRGCVFAILSELEPEHGLPSGQAQKTLLFSAHLLPTVFTDTHLLWNK